LRRARVKAVLTGGACASLYAAGAYTSFDIDFIIQSATGQATLDAGMATVDYRRVRDHYIHPSCPFWVEFPAGPLGIGSDYDLTPVEMLVRRAHVTTLSATDACRDRLAGYYHWNDVQSLDTAIHITVRNPIDFKLIERWSVREGATDKFQIFRRRAEAKPAYRRE
jgi:hypothetical protein